MKEQERGKEHEQEKKEGVSRRDMLKIGGLGGLALSVTALVGGAVAPVEAQGAAKRHSPHVPPGELDDYYGFWSGGQSGEVRILGIPSMRVLKRVPVFNFDCTYGHGITNHSKKLIGEYKTGDTHRFHLSYKDGWYDGQYGFVNDKSHARLARIRLDYMETDAIVEIPNYQGTHGIFPSRHTLKDVYCNAEFATPIDNNGQTADDLESYVALHTCIDGRVEGNPYTLYIPIPKSPHGVNVDPTGRYAICSGKLSPTCSVVDLQKIDAAFAGQIKPRDCVVAEPEVGLGPLHTAFDGRGNAYTSLFLDSAVVKWDIAKAVAGGNPILDKLDIHYQIGHINASNSETQKADGQWLIALNKFAKGRFLSVGPFHPENEQLVDVSGEKMKIVHDSPTHSEPHDAIIASLGPFQPKKRWDRTDAKFDFERKLAEKHGVQLEATNQVFREGNKVTVFMTSVAPTFV
jgi:nitrous oxide reductase